VFIYQLSSVKTSYILIEEYGFIPGNLTGALEQKDMWALLVVGSSAITALFLHGGWIHVFGNLLYLRVFGDNVEDQLGHAWFLIFFLLCGAVGAVCQFLFDPASSRPMIGASGAVAGVLGCYVTLFPRARVLTLFPAVIFLMFIEVHASAFIGIWCLQQFLNGFLSITHDPSAIEEIAWFSHLGGFGCGVFCALLVRWRRRSPR
jgi:membrane associated rhomboid family serine protease